MELAFIIWAVGTLPSMAFGLCFLMFCTFMCAAGFAAFLTLVENDVDELEENKFLATKFKRVCKCIFWISFPLWVITLLVPDQKTSYQMLAAYGVQAVVQNETTQELASDGVDVLKALMAKAKKELDVEK